MLHGVDSHPGAHWQTWLADTLANAGHVSFLVDLPEPSAPDRIEWLDQLCARIGGLDPERLIIVGHSLGAVTALDYIERSPVRIKALVAVSGFPRAYGSPLNESFMSAATIDFERVRERVATAAVFMGDDDPYVPQSELHALANELRVEPYVIHEGKHLNTDSGYSTFTELLQTVSALAA